MFIYTCVFLSRNISDFISGRQSIFVSLNTVPDEMRRKEKVKIEMETNTLKEKGKGLVFCLFSVQS